MNFSTSRMSSSRHVQSNLAIDTSPSPVDFHCSDDEPFQQRKQRSSKRVEKCTFSFPSRLVHGQSVQIFSGPDRANARVCVSTLAINFVLHVYILVKVKLTTFAFHPI